MSRQRGSWPPWNATPLPLFHGTTLEFARNILSQGVNLEESKNNTDFGRGFYTTTRLSQALAFAKKTAFNIGGIPHVVRFEIDREDLGSLKIISFVQGAVSDLDYWSFVYGCRNETVINQFDVTFGPVAKTWWGPEDSSIWPEYDQISFHTTRAVQMLNAAAPIMEPL